MLILNCKRYGQSSVFEDRDGEEKWQKIKHLYVRIADVNLIFQRTTKRISRKKGIQSLKDVLLADRQERMQAAADAVAAVIAAVADAAVQDLHAKCMM